MVCSFEIERNELVLRYDKINYEAARVEKSMTYFFPFSNEMLYSANCTNGWRGKLTWPNTCTKIFTLAADSDHFDSYYRL